MQALTLNLNEEIDFISLFLKLNIKPVAMPSRVSVLINVTSWVIRPLFKIERFENAFINWYIEKLDHYLSVQDMYWNIIPNFSQGHAYNEYYNISKYDKLFEFLRKEITSIDADNERVEYIVNRVLESLDNLEAIKNRLALFTYPQIFINLHYTFHCIFLAPKV